MSVTIYKDQAEAREAADDNRALVLGCMVCGCLWTPESSKRMADVDCPKCKALYSQIGHMHGEAWD
jgi:hypothetical protein